MLNNTHFYHYGVIIMKHLNKSALAVGVLLALGSTSSAWANPNNHAGYNPHGDNTQTATLDSTQGGNTSPQANEYSTATQDNNSDNRDNSNAKADDAAANNHSTANSDRSDHSYAAADDAAANNHSTASSDRSDHSDHSDNSYATADDAAANNHSTANSDRSDHSVTGTASGDGSAQSNDGNANGSYAGSKGAATNVGNATVDNSYADVSGTGAAANGGGDASFTDSHNVDNSYAKSEGNYSAAANNHSTAEVHMAIANSNLDGYVTHNTTTFNAYEHSDFKYEGNNNAGGAVAGASGVINFSQNTGQNALTQQSVSTQASLTVN
jgi:hypothetical protein